MNESSINTRNEDIDSKIADFMADIDEIVLGRKSTSQSQLTTSEWIQCFDETSQSVYYWNTKTNECSWDPPKVNTQIQNVDTSIGSNHSEESNVKRRCLANHQHQSPKKVKKTSLIAEYTSSESETTEEEQTADDIDELLEEVLEKGDKAETKPLQIDRCPLFETDCRAAIARLLDLEMRNKEVSTLRIQLETRLEDVLAGHLSKPYATRKLEETVVKIDELEKLHLTSMSSSVASETAKPSLTSSEMALLLSLPPPPPPPSPPPPSVSYVTDDPTLQLFYAQLNSNPTESVTSTKSELHQHHHSHKEKKSKPSKTLPTGLIQKWTHALQELRGIGEINEP